MKYTSLYTRCVSSLIFPFQEKLKKHDTVAIRKQLEQSQWWPHDQLENFRLNRLREMLVNVEKHVPYYRKIFASTGFQPTSLTSLVELQRLPFLTKALIRSNTPELTSDKAEGLARFNTGGSSGEPLIFFIGKERISHDIAAKWRATRWWGVDIGDPEIVVWGSPIELGAQDRIRYLRDRLMRTELLPAFEMSSKHLNEFVARIHSRRPRMLFGYPSSISLIARHAKSSGIKMNNLGIQVAFVTSERLYDDQRSIIEEVFGCPVANGYGSRDAGFIAHQCPSGSMHLTAEDIIVEIIGANNLPVAPGDPGEIVVTHLATQDFPIIRYRTGDIAIMDDKPCDCGRNLPVLREIQGRNTDFVLASDGTIMHGLALIYTLRDIIGIEAFKIIQESLELTRVLIVPNENCNIPAAVARIQHDFAERLGQDVQVNVETVVEIPAEKSGKYRYVVSKVSA
jgi:phenylacetate-CoA ligase